MGRTFSIELNRLGVSQRLYLSNSSVGKVLRRDLIQSLWKNFNNCVTLYLGYPASLGSGVNVNWALRSKKICLSTSSSDFCASAGRVNSVNLHQKQISHF